MHLQGIGVIVDWVPGHFSSNSLGLSEFDGTELFEYADHRKAWGATLFDYSKEWSQNFLLSSVDFWLREMHVDGIRVDSLDTILDGATDASCVKRFMQKMNAHAKAQFPGVLMIAECWKSGGITSTDGFGFDVKWTGATNDILRFLSKGSGKSEFHLVTEALLQKNERLLWHTDHDKSRKEKGSLYQQMPGTHFEKCANVRLLMSFFFTLVGKKMVFMGDELLQVTDWDSQREHSSSSVEWQKEQEPDHQGMQQMVKQLNALYKTLPDLQKENTIVRHHTDLHNQVIVYRRGSLLCVCNFGHNSFGTYEIPYSGHSLKEIFSSDDAQFGGSGKINSTVTLRKNSKGKVVGFALQLPPLATLILVSSGDLA